MAALLFRRKGLNLSCASPASTTTSAGAHLRLSADRRISGEADRQTPQLRREEALDRGVPPPLSKNKAGHHPKGRRSSGKPSVDLVSPATSTRHLLDDIDDVDGFLDVFQDLDTLPPFIPIDPARFRSASGDDSAALRPSFSSSSFSSSSSSAVLREGDQDRVNSGTSTGAVVEGRRRWPPSPWPSVATLPGAAAFQAANGGASAGDQGRSRPLERVFHEASSSLSSRTATPHRTTPGDHSAVLKPSSSSSSGTQERVVVLRVSLHCKGCEAKVRKHISRMKGVTSFSIDFATKKVTVAGDVTPLGVLSSVSKVKSAQFWTSPPPPPPPPSSSPE